MSDFLKELCETYYKEKNREMELELLENLMMFMDKTIEEIQRGEDIVLMVANLKNRKSMLVERWQLLTKGYIDEQKD